MPATERRRQGTGSVYQRKNGTWAGHVDLGWAEGRRKRRTIYAKTQAEAEAVVERILSRPPSDRDALVTQYNGGGGSDELSARIAADARATHTVEAWIAKRDAVGCCIYCGVDGPLTQDHVIPVTRGGDNSIGNVVPACLTCNAAKGADTAYEFIRRQLLK